MSKHLFKILFTSLLLIFFLIGHAQKIYYAPGNENWKPAMPDDSTSLLYSIYLLGDIKYPFPESDNLKLLKTHISKEGEQSAIIILGDILYPLGLPDSTDKRYTEAKQNLDQILNTLDSFKGEIVFLPGNHDWSRGRQEGFESVTNEEKYIEQYLDRGNIYLPDLACPGPVEVELTQDITLIVFDSQWWFQKNEKPGADGECGFLEKDELFIEIEDFLRRNKDKKVLFTTHHPLFSVGNHGGYFPTSYLLFPLLEFKKWMYLPLPGFIYTGYRKFLGDIQYLAHPEYKIFKEKLLEIFRDNPNIIYAAGHEHNLQYFEKDSLHHIVSGGGGGEGTYISRRKKKTDFAYKSAGFNKLSFYSNGNVWMEFICPDSTKEGEVVFSKLLFNKPVFDPTKKSVALQNLDYSDSIVQVKINDIYIKRKFHRFLMGDNYRELWNTTVELPVFDIGTEKGGLKILKRGGGQQTRSIRMEDKNGKQYVLRSVNKFIDKAMADNMQNTIAVDVVQDGISASHPFSAITVPPLADAAGVMHTNPKIVWVPDDPRLGIYRNDLANDVFLFEERPAGNRDDVESFQQSEDIVNTAKVINKTQKDHDYKVDQEAVVRARLFDILINDWDRHDDQWRWASFKNDKKTIYRPIPRDRDQVYFVNEGIVMWLATRNWAMRKFQGFDYDIIDVIGLGFNARYFDRSFMSEPDLASWKSIANDIQNNITDTIIHEAIQTLPQNIYELSGNEIENKLKSRRDLLDIRAEEYYRFLSKGVDVVGTNDRELFDVTRLENGNTQVTVFALSNKKGKIKEQFYSREFVYDETKEIRLYGLSGKDSFKLNGSGKKGIKVRIIGGKGNDSIVDNSKVRGLGKKTIVYDRKDKKNEIIKSGETRLILSNKKSISTYNRKQFKYNKTTPLLAFGYNIDDGIIIGGGALFNRYNFRDSTEHKITGNLAIRTGAFAISYEGLISSFSKTFDLILDGTISFPRNVDNYFGLGNETKKITNDKSYYRVRYSYAWLNPMLKQTISDNLSYSFGAFYQYFKVTDTSNRFIGDIYNVLLDSVAYLPHNYTGINAIYTLDTRNNKVIAQRGILWKTEALGFYSIREEGKNFVKIRSDLSFYLSFNKDPRVVFAFRFGGATNIGENEFYHSNFLGGKTNLRGFRSNRFAGDHSFYQNTEIRIKLLNIKSYVLNGQTGILFFNDIGRVWLNGENSKKWHDGYGLGIWLTPFDFTALAVFYSRSVEESLISFTFKFLF
ncbi:MAG: BamA/TamA family outer membrane protein [Bacteroidales bacterium]